MTSVTVEELKKIVDLANSVPAEYREKCFELLLSHSLQGGATGSPQAPAAGTSPVRGDRQPKDATPFVIPIDVKAFLSQYGLNETRMWKLFIVQGADIRPVYQLRVTRKATAEIQHALLMCIESALSSGQFQVDMEALRTRCQEQKCYDSSNFTKNLTNNSSLFKVVSSDQPLALSPDGKSQLAELIEQLTGSDGQK